MQTEQLEGGCLCRAVRYRVSGPPSASTLCHCRSCQMASAAPTVAWATWREADFAWVAGSASRYASSADVIRTFCNQCGTPLTYQNATKDPGNIDVTTISLDETSRFPPDREIWTEDKVEWERLNPAIPHHRRSSVDS